MDIEVLYVQVVTRLLHFGSARGGDGGRRPLRGEGEEVGQQLVAVGAADRLGMKLQTPQRKSAVAHTHHDAVLGPRQFLEVVGERCDGQGVVAHDLERRRDAREEVSARVMYVGDAAVHGLGRVDDRTAEEVAEALVAKADTKHR